MAAVAAACTLALAASAPAAGDQWYQADLHVHSVVSGDALTDMGIISQAAKQLGYNAMFITDHQAGSNFPISTVVANHVVFEDDLGSKWNQDVYGTPTSTTDQLVTSPVRSGTSSLHLKATATSSGESFVDLKRGPNLRSGDLILKFSAYPTRIDAGSGLYVSASIGGDASVDTPVAGYTTNDDVISPGKSTVMVWQLGNARAASSNPSARVITHQLPYALNQWNDYEIDVTTGAAKRNGSPIDIGSQGLGDIPAADRPLDYNALNQLKMSAAASGGGTADGYFDAYHLDASAPVPSGDEFAYRNTQVHRFDTSTFVAFPSIEMGFNRHAQRFNFPITSASEYNSFFQCDAAGEHCKITRGIDGILPTQQTGYPAQLNHPNLPGGVKLDEIVADNYQAFGADAMEVRQDTGGVPTTTMIDIWDSVLQHGVVVMGTGSSDMHKTDTLRIPDRGEATFIRAPALQFDSLMRSVFEGREYVAQSVFGGRMVFNLDPSSAEPYPARYPLQVSDSALAVPVHLSISGGIPAGGSVVWLVNGTVFATDKPSGSSYEATKSIPVTGSFDYVRAEVRRSDGWRIALSEPIFFHDVNGMPQDVSLHVDGVATANSQAYTKVFTKGITSSSWSAAAQTLSVGLDDPVGSLVTLTGSTGSQVPTAVLVDGASLPATGSPADFAAAAGSTWLYDPATRAVSIKALHASGHADVTVQFGTPPPDTQKPTPPGTPSATAAGPGEVDLSWAASSDDFGVTGYRVLRGADCASAAQIGTVAGNATAYSDTSVTGGSTYSYAVQAVDAAGNASDPSGCATVTTPSTATLTFTPVADSYVAADSPTKSYGTATKLRADSSPDTRSYLRFDLQGVSGTVTKATLGLSATSASSAGFDVRRVADTTWGEISIDYANAPALDTGPALGSSLGFATGGTPSVDVTPAVAGNGAVGFALTTPSSTALSLASREGGAATAPKLVVQVSGSPPPVDGQPPSKPGTPVPTASGPTQVDLTWAASTDDVGVTGYRVLRGPDCASVAQVGSTLGASAYSDTSVSASTAYYYAIEALDAAGHVSQRSDCATVTTPPPPPSGGGTTLTFSPVADSYVEGDTPARNYGTAVKLRADASPDTRSYLRFNVQGVTGTVVKATLRTTATSASTAGYDVRSVPDTSWGETTIDYSNAPAFATGLPLGTSLGFAAGGTPSVDVTPAVTGNGLVSFALTTPSATALSVASREAVAAQAPQLIVQTG
jgi:hypothetical protein